MSGPTAPPTLDPRAAANERLRVFGLRLERTGLDDFRQMALSATAARDRASARSAAVRAIAEAGLGDLAEDARGAAIAFMDAMYASGGFHPTWVAPDDVVDALRAPFELIAHVHPMPHGGDALPTLGDVRRLGPVWGSVAVLLVGLAVVGWFLGEWPVSLTVAVGAALIVGAWLHIRRDPAAP